MADVPGGIGSDWSRAKPVIPEDPLHRLWLAVAWGAWVLDHWSQYKTLAPWEVEVGMRVTEAVTNFPDDIFIVHSFKDTSEVTVEHKCPNCPGHVYTDWSHVGTVYSKRVGQPEDDDALHIHNPVHLKRAA